MGPYTAASRPGPLRPGWRIGAILGLVLLGTPSGGCRTQAAASPDDLVRRVLGALRSGEVARLDPVLPTEQDFRDLFRLEREGRRRGFGLALARRLPPKVARKVRRGFETARGHARSMGIRWADVVVERVSLRTQPGKFPPGAEAADLWVHLRAGTRRFRLWLDDCFRSERGWVIGEHLGWREGHRD